MKKLPPTDTSPEAQRILIDAYRRMTPAEKWRRLDDMYRLSRSLHATGFRLRHPGASDRDVVDEWLSLSVGHQLAQTIKEMRCGTQH